MRMHTSFKPLGGETLPSAAEAQDRAGVVTNAVNIAAVRPEEMEALETAVPRVYGG
jgi:hypothetical protein